MFKMSDATGAQTLTEIINKKINERVIPYDLYIDLANVLGTLPNEAQQYEYYENRTGETLLPQSSTTPERGER